MNTPPTGDGHCRRTGCRCTHDAGCYRGWLEPADRDRVVDVPAVPCPVCRPGQYAATQLHRDDPAALGRLLRSTRKGTAA